MNRKLKVLAIETSCDDTSISVIDENKNILFNFVNSQNDIHRIYNGIVPEIASRHHLENINIILEYLIKNIDLKFIDAIAATNTPGLNGSLLIGMMTAKTLGFVLEKPVIPINHLLAHIWANFLRYDESTEVFSPEFPALILLVSGGHTNLYIMNSFDYRDIVLLGETRDDAVGEAFDKVSKMLKLGYPGGPVIDKIYSKVDKNLFIKFPRPYLNDTYDFSFSGLKTAILYYTKSLGEDISVENKEVIVASFQDVAIKVLIKKLYKATGEFNIKTIMISGGVAANEALRREIENLAKLKNIKYHFPPKNFCTDNAAMCGSLAIDMINIFGLEYFFDKNKDPDFLKVVP